MSFASKMIIIVAGLLIIYGYLCRAINFYFFWDSKPIGWLILIVGVIFYFSDLVRLRRSQNKSSILFKILIGIIVFGLIITGVLIFMLKNSPPFQATIVYLESDSTLRSDIGPVRNVGLIPTGSIESTIVNGSESGRAVFHITVMGSKKYKDFEIKLEKSSDTGWEVSSIE